MILNGKIIYILHLEYYSGASGLDLKSSLSNKANKPYEKRKDLKDDYHNTFATPPQ